MKLFQKYQAIINDYDALKLYLAELVGEDIERFAELKESEILEELTDLINDEIDSSLIYKDETLELMPLVDLELFEHMLKNEDYSTTEAIANCLFDEILQLAIENKEIVNDMVKNYKLIFKKSSK